MAPETPFERYRRLLLEAETRGDRKQAEFYRAKLSSLADRANTTPEMATR